MSLGILAYHGTSIFISLGLYGFLVIIGVHKPNVWNARGYLLTAGYFLGLFLCLAGADAPAKQNEIHFTTLWNSAWKSVETTVRCDSWLAKLAVHMIRLLVSLIHPLMEERWALKAYLVESGVRISSTLEVPIACRQ